MAIYEGRNIILFIKLEALHINFLKQIGKKINFSRNPVISDSTPF